MNYNWNWHIFFEPNPTGAGTYLDMLLSGLVLTIKTGLLAWIIALIFGTIIGILRSLPSKTASWIGFAYVELFRNMPLLAENAKDDVLHHFRSLLTRCEPDQANTLGKALKINTFDTSPQIDDGA